MFDMGPYYLTALVNLLGPARRVSGSTRITFPTRTITSKLRTAVEEELADIVIFALEFANQTGVDMTAAIESKLKQNAIKYPVEKSKGRSVKYTEL